MKNQFSVETFKKTWEELFVSNSKTLDFKLSDFWSWNTSDLLNNAMRWKLAEYIIARALWIDNWYRIEWDEYDLVYNDLKIEIKSWAYIQSWEQDRLSNISLTVKPTQNSESWDFKRHSDIYIFAILSHKDATTINPLQLEQWDFYIVNTEIMNIVLWKQKTIGLNSLLKLNPIVCNFENLKIEVEKMKNNL